MQPPVSYETHARESGMGRTRTVNGIEYPVSDAHPAAEVLPWMSDAELVALADDIKAKGQLVPIDRERSTRLIIDGRNRELGCRIAGVEPRYKDIEPTDAEIVGYVVSMNVPRRHLTPSQRAMVAAELANLLHGEKVNKSEADRHQCRSADETQENQAVSQARAAEMMDVSERSVRNAKAVQRDAPELVEPVKEGKIDVTTAAKVAKLPAKERKKVAKAADPKKAAKDALAKESVAQAHEEQNGDRDAEDPAPDQRFMPNAAEAAALSDQFRNWIARIRAVRTEMRKALPDREHVIAARIDFGGFDAQLTELVDTLDRNIPEHVCPVCCGTGATEEGAACKFCDGYGIVDKGHHDGLKAKWKHTRARFEQLAGGEQ